MSKKNHQKHSFASVLGGDVAEPSPEVNPLSAPEVGVEIPADVEDVMTNEFQEEEIIPVVVAGSNPSEVDPEELPDYSGITLPVVTPQFSPEEEAEILANTPATGVDHLGRPAAPSFDPRDPSKGFYQGIDPQTGERVYSK